MIFLKYSIIFLIEIVNETTFFTKVGKKPYFGNMEVKVGCALNIFIYMVLN